MRRLGEEVERLDGELASLARMESALRLRLGQVLEVLSRGGHFELGFSSMRVYALERCDRSARWAEAARCLARRVESLPQLRRGLAHGDVSWSMAELLARVAQPEDEARWLESAKSRTVRQMRLLVTQALGDAREAGSVEGRKAGSVDGREAGSVEGREAGSVEGREAGSVDGREAGSVDGREAAV
jgi:hypothetical protein